MTITQNTAASVFMVTDGYKLDHRRQYPKGITVVKSNLTARSDAHNNLGLEKTDGTVFFGLQGFLLGTLNELFADFFDSPWFNIEGPYLSALNAYLGPNHRITADHLLALHSKGYLPIKISALPEGTLTPIGVPMLVIENTDPEFAWLTNHLETLISTSIWLPITSASTARAYKKFLKAAAERTGASQEFVEFQGHDFSMRGMASLSAALSSGAAHLTAFKGTDTVPAINYLDKYYLANSAENLVGMSVPATEHSVMCAGGNGYDEYSTIRRLITELYPTGIVSIVSDTWDFWNVLTNITTLLKDVILQRDGKVVFRPDSGDPVKIICGDPDAPKGSNEYKGAVKILDEIFGHTVNAKGFKTLNQHVGLIYGDSITYQRMVDIITRLEAAGYASDNIVLGIGSFTYGYVTRDTYAMAIKATYVVINGLGKSIFKKPATDSGTKNSAVGEVDVVNLNGVLTLVDDRNRNDPAIVGLPSELRVVYNNGHLPTIYSLQEIRDRVNASI